MKLVLQEVYLLLIDLPASKSVFATSVLIFGIVLSWGKPLDLKLAKVFGAIVGLFRCYAYCESVIGAEMTSLFSYLIGFICVQLTISLSAWKLSNIDLKLCHSGFIGFKVCGLSLAFLSRVALSGAEKSGNPRYVLALT